MLYQYTTHDLSNKSLYPSHHVYTIDKCVNIYSEVEINEGDRATINGKTAILKTSKNLLGKQEKGKFFSGSYYEFTFKYINK